MIDEGVRLAKKSIEAYNEGGVSLFLIKSARKLRDRLARTLLLEPNFPPLSIDYKRRTFQFGYRDKYLYNAAPPVVMPEPSDTVIEAGVCQGFDTAMFGKLADRVIGFEPSPRNYTTAKRNLRKYDNVDIINEGLWNEKSELEIQYGGGGGDDSFLEPDSSVKKRGGTVPVNTLEQYVDDLDIDEVNFVKIEAEGAEPEILDGMGELRPEKIVVNADEERGGMSPSKEIMDKLQAEGYNLVAVTLGCVLFFVLDTEYHYAFRPEYRK